MWTKIKWFCQKWMDKSSNNYILRCLYWCHHKISPYSQSKNLNNIRLYVILISIRRDTISINQLM